MERLSREGGCPVDLGLGESVRCVDFEAGEGGGVGLFEGYFWQGFPYALEMIFEIGDFHFEPIGAIANELRVFRVDLDAFKAGAAGDERPVVAVGRVEMVFLTGDGVERGLHCIGPAEEVVGRSSEEERCFHVWDASTGVEVAEPAVAFFRSHVGVERAGFGVRTGFAAAPIADIKETAAPDCEPGLHFIAGESTDHRGHRATPRDANDADIGRVGLGQGAQEVEGFHGREHPVEDYALCRIGLHRVTSVGIAFGHGQVAASQGAVEAGHVRGDGDVAALGPCHRLFLLCITAGAVQHQDAGVLAGSVWNRDDSVGLVLVTDAVEHASHRDAGRWVEEFLRDDRRFAVEELGEWIASIRGLENGKRCEEEGGENGW